MVNEEFEKIKQGISSNIVGTSNHPLDFCEGEPLYFTNLSSELERIINHAITHINYEGKTIKLGEITYSNNQVFLFLRECSLIKKEKEIFLELVEEQEKEQNLIEKYYPYFDNFARLKETKEGIYFLYTKYGAYPYLPSDASDLQEFFKKKIEKIPSDFKYLMSDETRINPLDYYRINQKIGCLERTSVFQELFSDNHKIQYHTHFVLLDEDSGLSFSGYDKGLFDPSADILYAKINGAGVIYIRLDEDDIKSIKNPSLKKEEVIKNITEKTLSHRLIGISMTFKPYEKAGGRYTLYPIIKP